MEGQLKLHLYSIVVSFLFYGLLLMLGTFPSGSFPKVQFSKWKIPKSILAAVLGPNCSLRRLRGPNLTFGKLQLGKLHFWEVAIGKVPNTAESNSVVLNSQWLDLLWKVILIQALHILSTNLRLPVCTALLTLDGKDDMKVFKFDFR